MPPASKVLYMCVREQRPDIPGSAGGRASERQRSPHSRRRFVALLGLCLTLLSLCAVLPASADPRQPNILIVITDDERAIGSLAVEPTLSSWLKDGGTTFEHAYATTPFCCPSRASLITGLYAHNHGIMGAKDTRGGLKTVDAMNVFPAFQQGGYRVGLYGKYLNTWSLDDAGKMDPDAWVPTGIDDYAIVPSVGSWYGDMRADGTARWDVNGREVRTSDYSTTYIRDSVISFIEGNSDAGDAQPWLAYVAPIVPHAPATPDERYGDAPVPVWQRTPAQKERDRSDKPEWLRRIPRAKLATIRSTRANQLRSLMSVDAMLMEIRETLAALGEEDDTIVVYTSDNGVAWGEHGLSGKMTPYQESVGVPLYVRGPGVERGAVRQDMVALLDVAPTLLAAARIPYPRDFDGHDLFDGQFRHRLLLELDNDPSHRVPSWRAVLAVERGSPAPAYEFIRYLRKDGTLLANEAYELSLDPWQLTNTWNRTDPQERSLRLSRWLSLAMTCKGSMCAQYEGR